MPAHGEPSPQSRAVTTPSIRLPGAILGVGLGGFVDGILLHQILQWHHMLTSTDTDRIGVAYYAADTVHGLRINTVWDGLFHTFTWLCVLVGLGILYSAGRGSAASAGHGHAEPGRAPTTSLRTQMPRLGISVS